MKTIAAVLGVGALAIAAFFALNHYIYLEKQADSETVAEVGDVSLAGLVTAVDVQAMAADGPALVTFTTVDGGSYVIAVPSMGLPMCPAKDTVASVADIKAGDFVRVSGQIGDDGQIVPCESSAHYLVIDREYVDAELGYSFLYRVGPNGYVVNEDLGAQSTDPTYLGGVVLMQSSEAARLPERQGGEGPPTINVRVYDNAELESSSVFATTHPLESNIELALGMPAEFELDGANALRYVVDGLYLTDTIVAAHDDYAYIVSGSYLTEDSYERDDFIALIDSFLFNQEL